ncbi:MAG: bifunctional (p)ppGpp synthetase/guanosine-3',5'-bis(diphosphate) 3'-pyrophosphohydrolase, partial [Rhodocyclaceae bacterium]|nr:bifunctional (p)ppGpp synthetase/guanosine-3',5'-bis(diphosphate) 3'-pyrophosphohydrolase [Rhodocyclaceae bacterium]
NRCVACRVNGDLVPLRTELRNGDQVEVITAAHASPNPAWLAYVRTGKARAQIRHFLKSAQHDEAVALGERLLNQSLREHGLTLGQISVFAWDRFLGDAGVRDRREIFADLGLGKRLPVIVARRVAEAQDQESGRPNVIKPKPVGAVLIRGSEGTAVQLAKCCHPIPGDDIIATIRKGQGLEVHVDDCPVVARRRGDRGRWIEVGWEPAEGLLFEAAIRVLTVDNRGVLAKVAAAIADANANILNVTMDVEQAPYTALQFVLEVENRVHLARVIRTVRVQQSVTRVSRLKSEQRR